MVSNALHPSRNYKIQAPPPTTAKATAAMAAKLDASTLPASWIAALLDPLAEDALDDEAYGPVYVVAAFGMVEMLPSRIDTVFEPVKPPGMPVLIPVGGPVVGVAALIPCE